LPICTQSDEDCVACAMSVLINYIGLRNILTCLHTDETCIHVERHTIDKTGAKETTQEDQICPSCINISVKTLSNLRLCLRFLRVASHGFAVCVHSGRMLGVDFPYLVHNNKPAYLCIILIKIDISHDPENFVPLPDVTTPQSLCSHQSALLA
jgi:hypothetical protein